jgi:hypothetical protein
MNCEEFESIGLGLVREGDIVSGADAAERAAAIEHANNCPRCAALQESWQEARLGLQAVRHATQSAEAPARVEMRLRQEFRTRHGTLKMRRRLIVGAWTLATAAVLVGFVSWRTWRIGQTRVGNEMVAVGSQPPAQVADRPGTGGAQDTSQEDATSLDTLVADNEGDFTLLPGSLPQETENAAIFRVRLQRGALAEFGLPVNEDRAADWLQVDLLVGQDGQPRALRLPAESNQ